MMTPKDRLPMSWKPLFLLAFAAWLTVGAAPLILSAFPNVFPGDSWIGRHYLAIPVEKTGQVGDTFGLANSLFSALGVAGVAYALILQVDERKQAAKSEKESAKLALLTALIHARTALAAMNQA